MSSCIVRPLLPQERSAFTVLTAATPPDRGTLLDGGEQFDASYDRNEPFDFVLGQGSVIRGWDEGVFGMCPGEKRKLKIPAEKGYGAFDILRRCCSRGGTPPRAGGCVQGRGTSLC